MSHGHIVFGDWSAEKWPFEIFDIRLSKYAIEFTIAASLPGGTTIPSPCRAVIRSPDGEVVYSYTYEQAPIVVIGREPQWVSFVQTINFIPDRQPGWLTRERSAAASLPGPGRSIGPGGPRQIGR